jgi:hypothetical protein
LLYLDDNEIFDAFTNGIIHIQNTVFHGVERFDYTMKNMLYIVNNISDVYFVKLLNEISSVEHIKYLFLRDRCYAGTYDGIGMFFKIEEKSNILIKTVINHKYFTEIVL